MDAAVALVPAAQAMDAVRDQPLRLVAARQRRLPAGAVVLTGTMVQPADVAAADVVVGSDVGSRYRSLEIPSPGAVAGSHRTSRWERDW